MMKKPKIVEKQIGTMVVALQLLIAIDIRNFFKKFKMKWKLDLVRYILFIWLRCRKDHLNSQNHVLAV